MNTTIILASKSTHRADLLRNAGIKFQTVTAQISERDIEKPLLEAKLDGADVAEVLARAKADDVSSRNPSAWVIGCDQTLSLEGKLLHKCADMDEARRRLLELSGKTHHLNSAVTLVRDEEVIWSHVEVCSVTMRDLDPGFIGRHLAQVGDKILSSVGAYQIEGPGVQLFEKISGDYFSIIGLPILPLLVQLRKHDLVDG